MRITQVYGVAGTCCGYVRCYSVGSVMRFGLVSSAPCHRCPYCVLEVAAQKIMKNKHEAELKIGNNWASIFDTKHTDWGVQIAVAAATGCLPHYALCQTWSCICYSEVWCTDLQELEVMHTVIHGNHHQLGENILHCLLKSLGWWLYTHTHIHIIEHGVSLRVSWTALIINS